MTIHPPVSLFIMCIKTHRPINQLLMESRLCITITYLLIMAKGVDIYIQKHLCYILGISLTETTNKMKLLICVCFIFLAIEFAHGQRPVLDLYDGTGATGRTVRVTDYTENLQTISFNDLASSVCVVSGM